MRKKNLQKNLQKLPEIYRTTIEYVTDCIIENLKDNLMCVILGGSCGKNIPVVGWSDIDIYVILKKYDFDQIVKLNTAIEKTNIHIGITFYTESEIKNGFIDSRTKVMIYEKQILKCNPNLYGNYDLNLIDYNTIKNNDKDNIPSVLHEVRRMHIKVLNNGNKIDRKYIKKVILLLKCYFNIKGKFLYGYTNVVNEFLSEYNENENKSTNYYFFDIIGALGDITRHKSQIVEFVNRVLNYMNKEMERLLMNKRISSRGIIIEENCVYLMFRRRIKENGEQKEYYVIPGGGINEKETLEENVIRELKEEFSVDVKIKGYLGKDEGEDSIANFFSCEIVKGTPKLGGEELDRCCKSNYYEIKKVKIEDLDKIDVMGRDMIVKAYNDSYVER